MKGYKRKPSRPVVQASKDKATQTIPTRSVFESRDPKFHEKIHQFVFEVFIAIIFGKDDWLLNHLYKGSNKRQGLLLKEMKRRMNKMGVEWKHHYSVQLTQGRATKEGLNWESNKEFDAIKINGDYRGLPAPVAFESKFVDDAASVPYRVWKYVYEAKAHGYGGCVICLFDALGRVKWEEVAALEKDVNEYFPTEIVNYENYTGRKVHTHAFRMFHRLWKMSQLQGQPDLYREFTNEERIAEFNRRVESQRVTLLVGAGTTIAAGGPSWLALIDRLWQAELRGRYGYPHVSREVARQEVTGVIGDSVLIQARMLRRICGPGFMHKVRRQVYDDVNFSAETPFQVARLAQRLHQTNKLARVITFNYDNLLEYNLERLGERGIPIFGEQRSSEPGILVHHVHGYLPPPPTEISTEEGESVVFDEETYHSRFNQAGHWTNVTLLDSLQHSVCVFVGFSMTDPNVRRLLEQQKRPDQNPHFILLKLPDLRLDDPDLQLTRAQLVHTQENMMRDLGLNVIWYEEHGDLPAVLDLLAHEQMTKVC